MKIFVTALSFVFLSSVLPTAALAGIMNGKGNCSGGVCTDAKKTVACPAGTCSRAGTQYAIDLKYCSAANCRK